MLNATFAALDLTALRNLDSLGLALTVQQVAADRAVLECGVASSGATIAALTEGHQRLINDKAWADAIEVVAMNGFSSFTTAAEELPVATAVMDPFHVVKLAGNAPDQCRRRIQQAIHGHRGHAGDPLCVSRRVLHTGLGLLTGPRLNALFDTDAHNEVEVTWAAYLQLITAYRNPYRATARADLAAQSETLRTGVPAALVKLRRPGRTLNHRAHDILTFFDRPGTSNGPSKAINGRFEHLLGPALGFRNLTQSIARSILEAGGFRPLLHPQMRRA